MNIDALRIRQSELQKQANLYSEEGKTFEFQEIVREINKLSDMIEMFSPKTKDVSPNRELLKYLTDNLYQSWNISEISSELPKFYPAKINKYLSQNKHKIFRMTFIKTNHGTVFYNGIEYMRKDFSQILRKLADIFDQEIEIITNEPEGDDTDET